MVCTQARSSHDRLAPGRRRLSSEHGCSMSRMGSCQLSDMAMPGSVYAGSIALDTHDVLLGLSRRINPEKRADANLGPQGSCNLARTQPEDNLPEVSSPKKGARISIHQLDPLQLSGCKDAFQTVQTQGVGRQAMDAPAAPPVLSSFSIVKKAEELLAQTAARIARAGLQQAFPPPEQLKLPPSGDMPAAELQGGAQPTSFDAMATVAPSRSADPMGHMDSIQNRRLPLLKSTFEGQASATEEKTTRLSAPRAVKGRNSQAMQSVAMEKHPDAQLVTKADSDSPQKGAISKATAAGEHGTWIDAGAPLENTSERLPAAHPGLRLAHEANQLPTSTRINLQRPGSAGVPASMLLPLTLPAQQLQRPIVQQETRLSGLTVQAEAAGPAALPSGLRHERGGAVPLALGNRKRPLSAALRPAPAQLAVPLLSLKRSPCSPVAAAMHSPTDINSISPQAWGHSF